MGFVNFVPTNSDVMQISVDFTSTKRRLLYLARTWDENFVVVGGGKSQTMMGIGGVGVGFVGGCCGGGIK